MRTASVMAAGTAPRWDVEMVRRLPQDASAVTDVREALDSLEQDLDAGTLRTVRLLASELVTNSVEHGRSSAGEPIEVSVRASPVLVRVEVADAGPGFEPAPHHQRRYEGTGWGLHLVAALSDRWGTERGDRMRVWFEVRPR